MRTDSRKRRLKAAEIASSFHLGQRWESARNWTGLPANLAAKSMGVAPPRLTEIEHGDRLPTSRLIVQAALLFKCSSDYLVGLALSPSPHVDERVKTTVMVRIDDDLAQVSRDTCDALEASSTAL